jgi:hypothetical protein
MRIIRRRNWLIKRIALGLAIAAFAAPVAQAKVDEGSTVQSNGFQAFVTDFPSYPAGSVADIGALPVSARDYALAGATRVRLAHSLPRWTDPGIVATNYGTPRATAFGWPGVDPSDPSLTNEVVQVQPRVQTPSISEPRIEFVRQQPRSISEPRIEFIRTHPRPIGEPQVVSAGFDWKDAGIGAGLALALVLLGGGAVLASRHVGRAQTA